MDWRVMAQTDCNGETPEIGDFVAYNYSGDIATGWIIKIGKKDRGGSIYTIHQVAPEEGHISKVRGGSMCVLVLEKASALEKELEEIGKKYPVGGKK